ncbi:hypothetical protein F4859DRAFT_338597 [Xylaria cf. heliscus]|nr:hypothetical protein F4859DRAFT_338597 [Xylaria cf. heliscus]
MTVYPFKLRSIHTYHFPCSCFSLILHRNPWRVAVARRTQASSSIPPAADVDKVLARDHRPVYGPLLEDHLIVIVVVGVFDARPAYRLMGCLDCRVMVVGCLARRLGCYCRGFFALELLFFFLLRTKGPEARESRALGIVRRGVYRQRLDDHTRRGLVVVFVIRLRHSEVAKLIVLVIVRLGLILFIRVGIVPSVTEPLSVSL